MGGGDPHVGVLKVICPSLDKVLMHKTRSKANGDNELYTPHNGRPFCILPERLLLSFTYLLNS